MWLINQAGEREFTGGRESWGAAAGAAADCRAFRADVEEEMVTDDERSCYDCRYRRWTATSFVCRAPQSAPALHEKPQPAQSASP